MRETSLLSYYLPISHVRDGKYSSAHEVELSPVDSASQKYKYRQVECTQANYLFAF